MKTLRQFSASAVLLLVLALPTLAGDMHSPAAPPPPPPPASTTIDQQNSESGDMTQDGMTAGLDPLTELALLMLQGALALF